MSEQRQESLHITVRAAVRGGDLDARHLAASAMIRQQDPDVAAGPPEPEAFIAWRPEVFAARNKAYASPGGAGGMPDQR